MTSAIKALPYYKLFYHTLMHITKIKFKALFQHIATEKDGWQFSTVNSHDVDFLVFRQLTEWLQATGLHDKNGTEIYDGDLIKWDDYIVEVVYENGSYKVLNDGNTEMLLWHCVPECEVMGSKYEKDLKL